MQMLVTGATGFVGRSLVPALMTEGHRVRAGTRHPDRYQGPGQAVAVDVHDPTTLGAALDGCDVAYYLVHGLADRGDFAAQESRSAKAFAQAAADRGVRVVYLGGLGASSLQLDRSPHLKSRHRVGAILRETVETVELQAAVVIGSGSAMFETLREVVVHFPVLLCPDWIDTRTQPIAGADVVRYLTAAATLPAGRYEIGGADVLTYADMVVRYAHLTGRSLRLVRFPVAAPAATAMAMTRLTEVIGSLPGLSSARLNPLGEQPIPLLLRLAEGLSVETIVSDDRIRVLVPFEPLGFDEACRAAGAGAGAGVA